MTTKAIARPNPAPALHLYRVDDGRATPLDWATAHGLAADPAALPETSWVWLHLDRSSDEARNWLETRAGFSEDAVWALTSDDTRPRAAELDGGLVVILRGLSRDATRLHDNPVSVRLFIDAKRVISLRLRPFAPTYDLDAALATGAGPETTGGLLADLVETTLEQIEAQLDGLGKRFDQLEELALAAPDGRLRRQRTELNGLKRAVIVLRRFLKPQEEALTRLAALAPAWLPVDELPGLREASDQTKRIVEDLDELRDRGLLIGDEMQARLNDRMNRTLVTLAVVSTVFLPLTMLTGLFGVNLAGIPFAEAAWAFPALVGGLGVVAALTTLLVLRFNRG